jgi:hypothetical protein
MKVGIWLLDRLVPTLLMGASAALLTAGLLSYAPSAFGEWQTPAPIIGGGDPRLDSPAPSGGVAWASGGLNGSGDLPSTPVVSLAPGETPAPAPSGLPTDYPSDQPPATAQPGITPVPTVGNPGWPTPHPTASPPGITPAPSPATTPRPTPVQSGNAVATRVVIPSLDIDLPLIASNLVVPGNVDFYPLCDVAMYMVGFVNPGQPGTTYIYGHAQDGMFAPLLHASKYNDGASMIGSLVQVYTADNKLHLYEIFKVKRHATDLTITQIPAGTHQLVLQTSEGWHGHIPKLQIAARPLTVLPASYADAHPTPHPRVCVPN